MMRSINRIVRHLHRMANARRFGVPFHRLSTFRVPATVRHGDRAVALRYPAEHGISSDFLTCFINDEYGLGCVCQPLRTIADIGANVGFFSVAAKLRFSAALIHAYEPNPRILPHLQHNSQEGGFQVFSEAVGARSGWVDLVDAGDSNQARTVATAAPTGIRQISLGTVVERLGGTVDLAKIDCEGAEWDLFTDPEPWRVIRQIRMEYHLWGKHTFAEVRAALDGLGFTIHHHRAHGAWGIVWAKGCST